MKALNITMISHKYAKYSNLIGGIVMVLIGILMIFKMEWLMFNF
jgi:putative Mn2+ efflux pump MntP